MCSWIVSSSSSSAPSRNGTSGSSGCGSPTSGFLKSVAVAPAELEGAFSEGIGFDGSAIEGFARVFESDMVARPDPSTFQVLPWEADGGRVYSARMFCDITMPDGSPSWADPRHVLRRAMGEAAAMGFTCYVHPEIEFFLLKDLPDDGSVPEPADQGGFFDQASHDAAPHFRRRAIETLEAMGISVEFSHHEGAPGQQEIDLRYADALTMADNIMSFRYVVKEVALTQGVRASFMPKPFVEQPGSAMHTHFSLFDGETNAFHSPEDEYQLSATGKHFLAGVIKHAPEITAVSCQWVNSYKRLVVGDEAPTTASGNREPVGAGPGAELLAREVLEPAVGVPAARLRLQPLPDVHGGDRRRAQGHPGGVRTAGARRGQRVVAVRGRTAGHGLPEATDVAGVRAGRDGRLGAGRGGAGEHVFDFFLRNKRGMGGLPPAGHPPGTEAVPAL